MPMMSQVEMPVLCLRGSSACRPGPMIETVGAGVEGAVVAVAGREPGFGWLGEPGAEDPRLGVVAGTTVGPGRTCVLASVGPSARGSSRPGGVHNADGERAVIW